MKIDLTSGLLDTAKFVRSPNHGGGLVRPTLLVLHYTASGGKDGAADAEFFSHPKRTSAHFVVGRDGGIIQCVPVGVKAWHAGVSIWRGVSNCNDYSIGIEIDNWGYLNRTMAGTYKSYSGEVVTPDQVIHALHKNGAKTPEYWEAYKDAQIEAVCQLSKTLLAALPSIKDIVGHEDIAPGRKTDPGPAWPWTHFRSVVEGNKTPTASKSTSVNVRSLNVRAGPGVNYPVISTLPQGAMVTEEYTTGDWSRITANDQGRGVDGWASSQYLTRM